MNTKGQLSLINIFFYGIILVPISLIIAAIMSGVIGQILGTGNFSGLDTLIISFIVTFFILGIIVTFFIYVVPQFAGNRNP